MMPSLLPVIQQQDCSIRAKYKKSCPYSAGFERLFHIGNVVVRLLATLPENLTDIQRAARFFIWLIKNLLKMTKNL